MSTRVAGIGATRTRRPLFLLMLVLIASGCLGCWGDGDDDDGPCDNPYTGASLDGAWELHGSGKRAGCEDRRLEGKLELDTTAPLVIEAAAQPTFRDAGGPITDNESDAFIQRIERADYELSGDELPHKVTFAGQSRARASASRSASSSPRATRSTTCWTARSKTSARSTAASPAPAPSSAPAQAASPPPCASPASEPLDRSSAKRGPCPPN